MPRNQEEKIVETRSHHKPTPDDDEIPEGADEVKAPKSIDPKRRHTFTTFLGKLYELHGVDNHFHANITMSDKEIKAMADGGIKLVFEGTHGWVFRKLDYVSELGAITTTTDWPRPGR